MLVNWLRRLGKIKFATWVANGQLLCGDAPGRGINCPNDGQNAQRRTKTPPWPEPGGVQS